MNDNLPFIYPADIDKSWKHRLANRIFKGVTQESTNNERCECCDRRVGEEDAQKPCWYSPIHDLIFLGPGVPLLFVFIQNAMLLLAFLIALFFFFSLLTNILGNSCEVNTKCIVDVFNELSISNKINDNESMMIQTYLVAGFLMIYIVFSQYMIYRIRKRNDVCDQIIHSPSDYSIIIKDLPQEVEEKDIENMINKHRLNLDADIKLKTKNLSLKKIIISYSLDYYLKERSIQEQQFLRIKKEDQNAQFVRIPIKKPTTTAQFAIVVFDIQQSKETFFENLSIGKKCRNIFLNCCQSIGSFTVKDKQVLIERAPQPDDILWENADTPKSTWVRNIIISYFFGILILAAGGVIQYFLQYYQLKITDVALHQYFSYATSIIITIFNAVIIQFLIFVTKLEGNYTKTDLERSLLVKICLYSFFNAGIFYSLANILAQSLNSFNIQGSFSFEVTLFMSMNAISPNLSNLLLSKLEFPALIFRCLVRLSCLKYTQKQANQLFELTTVDFPVKYAYVIRTVWLTCFYAPFAPIIVPISLIGLIIFYFTETELFRTSYKVPNMLSIRITKTAIRLLDYTGIIFSGGQILIVFYIKFIFESQFTIAEQIGIALCLFFSLILVFLPSTKINKKLFPFTDDHENEPTYDSAKQNFQITYEGTNPLSDPSERIRKNDINLFKFLNVVDIFQMKSIRKSHQGETSMSNSNTNPLLNMINSPNNLFDSNQSGNQSDIHYGNQLAAPYGNQLGNPFNNQFGNNYL